MSVDYAAQYAARQEQKKANLAVTRTELRMNLLASALLHETPLVFQAEFDGYGDSGRTHVDTGNREVDHFLMSCVDAFVTFDWYNNDGGGGDITWDVQTDKITINGYYNETVRTDAMTEAVF